MSEEKQDFRPQWRLEALKIAAGLYQNPDGGCQVGASNQKEFIDFADSLVKWVLAGKEEQSG